MAVNPFQSSPDSTARQHSFYDAGPTTASFTIEIEEPSVGPPLATFQEVSGFEVSVETKELREGGENGFVHKLPGRISYPNLVLRRGVSQDNYLYNWIEESQDWMTPNPRSMKRRTLTLSLWGASPKSRFGTLLSSGPGRQVLRAWEFSDAFAVSWKAPSFSVANGDEFPVEELEIAHSGFRVSVNNVSNS